jgi:UV DNA damage endonuclease
MNLPEGKMVLHIGSGQQGKQAAMNRFIENFWQCPKEIASRLILENDDKIFTAKDVLTICKEIHTPMVLDIHHHICHDEDIEIGEILEDIFDTWKDEMLPPKMHISSPREREKDRRHADFIHPDDFISLVELCKSINRDFDVMLEAKQKEVALYQLIRDIKQKKKDWCWIDETTLEI